MYDIIVVGAGPAGISAGIYGVSRGKKVLILEKGEVGGLIGKVSTVTHYAGIVPGETGDSFATRMQEQAESAGVEIRPETVEQVQMQGDVKTVVTDQGRYTCKKLILANGTTGRKLGIPGETELAGKGMGMNAAKHGANYAGKHVYVVGGADGAVKEALYLASLAEEVTIIHFEPQLGCIAEFRDKVKKTRNIRLMLNTRLHAVRGEGQVEQLDLRSEVDGSISTVDDPGCGILCGDGTQYPAVHGVGAAKRLHPRQRLDGNQHSRRLRCGRHSGQAGPSGGHSCGRRCHGCGARLHWIK